MKPVYPRVALCLLLTLTACTVAQQSRYNGREMSTASSAVVLKQDRISIPQDRPDRSPNGVSRLVWHPKALQFAVVDSELHILIFDAVRKQMLRKLPKLLSVRSSTYPVVAYSPNGQYLAAGKDVVSLFNASTGQKIRDIIGPYSDHDRMRGGGVKSIAFSPDSQVLAIAYSEYWSAQQKESQSMIAAYETATGQRRFVSGLPPYHSRSRLSADIVYTPDGKYVLVGRYSVLPYAEQAQKDQPFRYFTFIDYLDSQTGQFTHSITPVHIRPITALAMSADGRYLASATDTGAKQYRRRPTTDKWDVIDNNDPVKLWDLASRQSMRTYPIHKSADALAMSPDGRYLAVHHTLATVLFDFTSGRQLQTVTFPGSPGFSSSLQVGFSADSKMLAVPLDTHVYLLTLK